MFEGLISKKAFQKKKATEQEGCQYLFSFIDEKIHTSLINPSCSRFIIFSKAFLLS